MNCPKCDKARCVTNIEAFKHNFDQGTLTDEYYADAVCMICGTEFKLKMIVGGKQS